MTLLEGSVSIMDASQAGQGCGCRVSPVDDARLPALAARHRVARVLAGGGFAALSWLCWSSRVSRPVAVAAGWFALSHVVAGITAYPGCPELGAIPSLIPGASVRTRCGPWKLLDARIDGSA